MIEPQGVYVVTRAGRIHRAAIVNDRTLTDEACNLDDAAGDLTVATELPESASPETCCDRCFPEGPAA